MVKENKNMLFCKVIYAINRHKDHTVSQGAEGTLMHMSVSRAFFGEICFLCRFKET